MKIKTDNWVFNLVVLVLLACIVTNTVVYAVHGGH